MTEELKNKIINRVINFLDTHVSGKEPDFILAEYLENCLKAFDYAVLQRTSWYRKEKDELNDKIADADF